MISLPVFPPCTPGNFVPELRTLAPVNHKINSNTVIVIRMVMIMLFHQTRLKALTNFTFFQFVNFYFPDAPNLSCIAARKKFQTILTFWALRVRREIESTDAVDFQGNS